MQCTISARRKEQEHMDYLAISEHGLEAIDENEGGDGSVKNPYLKKIKISNKNDTVWSGVIHVEVTFLKKIRAIFYRPLCMAETVARRRKKFLMNFQD